MHDPVAFIELHQEGTTRARVPILIRVDTIQTVEEDDHKAVPIVEGVGRYRVLESYREVLDLIHKATLGLPEGRISHE